MSRINGFFISFEGGEGSGKSSQAEKLYRALKRTGRKAILVRDPGSTFLGRHLRAIVLKKKLLKFSPMAEAMVFIAGRVQLVQERIFPAWSRGSIVICDRYHDSTMAYQGFGGRLDIEWLDKLGRTAIDDIMPDLTFLLDIPVKDGFARLRTRSKDRMEIKDPKFHERVRNGFRKLAAAEPDRFEIIDARLDKDDIHYKIRKIVEKRLENRFR